MANDRNDQYDGQDEGEYHFSDENAVYEDTETTRVADATGAKVSPLTAVNKYRRLLIAMGVFIALMFIVYKVIAPNQPSDLTISQAQPATSPAKPMTPPAPVVAVSPPASLVTPPATPPAQPETPAAPAQVAAAPAAPAAVTPADQAAMALLTTPPPPAQPTAPVIASSQPAVAQPQQPGTQGGVVQYDANKDINDKIAFLEQQNAKLTNVMQIEYAQRITDSENQAAAAQAKLKELSSRVANMEATLTQLTQALQGTLPVRSSSSSGMPSTGPAVTKPLYSVQAIIPGRAWLKSEAGETVTVAEGDVLREYGRVTKIDPYDGFVSIDTGNKVINLSYGTNAD